jgi:hypothetical protein
MKQVLSYKDGQRFKFTKRKLNEIMHNALLAGYLFVAKKVDENITIVLDREIIPAYKLKPIENINSIK